MGKAITGHVDLVFPSKYIKAADLRGRDVTIVIEKVEWEELVMEGNKRDIKPAITMRSVAGRLLEKKWIAGKTVLKQIAAATGEKDVGNWHGKRVTMYPSECRARAGGMTECVRVRVKVSRTQEEPPPEMTAPVEEKPFVDEAEAGDEPAEGSAT